MTEPIKFPDEPIRVDAGERATPRDMTPEEREEYLISDEWGTWDTYPELEGEDA